MPFLCTGLWFRKEFVCLKTNKASSPSDEPGFDANYRWRIWAKGKNAVKLHPAIVEHFSAYRTRARCGVSWPFVKVRWWLRLGLGDQALRVPQPVTCMFWGSLHVCHQWTVSQWAVSLQCCCYWWLMTELTEDTTLAASRAGESMCICLATPLLVSYIYYATPNLHWK